MFTIVKRMLASVAAVVLIYIFSYAPMAQLKLPPLPIPDSDGYVDGTGLCEHLIDGPNSVTGYEPVERLHEFAWFDPLLGAPLRWNARLWDAEGLVECYSYGRVQKRLFTEQDNRSEQ